MNATFKPLTVYCTLFEYSCILFRIVWNCDSLECHSSRINFLSCNFIPLFSMRMVNVAHHITCVGGKCGLNNYNQVSQTFVTGIFLYNIVVSNKHSLISEMLGKCWIQYAYKEKVKKISSQKTSPKMHKIFFKIFFFQFTDGKRRGFYCFAAIVLRRKNDIQ